MPTHFSPKKSRCCWNRTLPSHNLTSLPQPSSQVAHASSTPPRGPPHTHTCSCSPPAAHLLRDPLTQQPLTPRRHFVVVHRRHNYLSRPPGRGLPHSEPWRRRPTPPLVSRRLSLPPLCILLFLPPPLSLLPARTISRTPAHPCSRRKGRKKIKDQGHPSSGRQRGQAYPPRRKERRLRSESTTTR
jgi:hypothetical protein